MHCAGGRVGVGDSSDTWRPGRSWRQGSFTSCKNLTFLNGEAKSVVSWKSSISFFYHSLQIRRWWLYKSVERFFSLSSNFLSVGNGPPCGWILRYLIRVTFNSNNRRKKLEAACDNNFCMKHISFKKSIGICPDFQKDIPKLTWNVKDLFKMLGADWSLIRRVAGFSKTWLATLHMSA